MAMGGMETAPRAVTAFFDDRAVAQAAVDDLVAAGVARTRITLVEGGAAPVAVEPVATGEKGLWATVRDLFMADEDRHAYGEGLRRGGVLLSVAAGAADHPRIVEILDREGAVDMDARQSDWELDGWDPARAAADFRAASAAVPAPAASASSDAADLRAAIEPAAAVGPAFAATDVAPTPGTGRSAVRDAEADGLRLRTYVAAQGGPDATR